MSVPHKACGVLQELAHGVAGIAARPEQAETIEGRRALNDLA